MIEPINDLEIQKLKKERRDLPNDAVLALDESLITFSESPRYPLISGVKLGVFLEGEASGMEISEKSLEDLAELGTYQLCQDPNVSLDTLEKLTVLFGKLVEEPDTVIEEPGDFDVTQYVPPAMETPETKYIPPENIAPDSQVDDIMVNLAGRKNRSKLSSIEEEQKLLTAFSRLKSSSSFERISIVKVGDYWSEENGRAPFIESMTFGQLVEIKVAHLLEKRSHTERKSQGILEAVESVLVDFPDENESPETAARGTTVGQSDPVRVLNWKKSEGEVPAIAEIVSGYFELQASRMGDGADDLLEILRLVPKTLSKAQFSFLWLSLEYDSEVVAQMVKRTFDEVNEIVNQSKELLLDRLNKSGSSLVQHWTTALAGPGVTEEQLFDSYVNKKGDSSFQTQFCRLLLSTLGASHPEAYANQFDSYWTSNPTVLQMILSGILASLPKSDDDLRSDLENLLPLFDSKLLIASLGEVICFHEERGEWSAIS